MLQRSIATVQSSAHRTWNKVGSIWVSGEWRIQDCGTKRTREEGGTAEGTEWLGTNIPRPPERAWSAGSVHSSNLGKERSAAPRQSMETGSWRRKRNKERERDGGKGLHPAVAAVEDETRAAAEGRSQRIGGGRLRRRHGVEPDRIASQWLLFRAAAADFVVFSVENMKSWRKKLNSYMVVTEWLSGPD